MKRQGNAKYLITGFLLIVCLVLLTSCASTKPCEPVYVNKVVTVPCIKAVPEAPKLTSIRLPDNATLAEQIQAISIDVLLLQQHNNELMAVIKGCLPVTSSIEKERPAQ